MRKRAADLLSFQRALRSLFVTFDKIRFRAMRYGDAMLTSRCVT